MSFYKVHWLNSKVAALPDGETNPACCDPLAAVLYFYSQNLATVHIYLAEEKKTISSCCVYKEQEGPHKKRLGAKCWMLQGQLAA